LLSLDATIGQTTDSSITLGETLPDCHYETLQSWQEESHELQLAIKQLEQTTQAAIQYVFLQDLPRKEAAKQIGVSPMTVTRHIQRGIEQLTTLLEPQAA
jgi:RNA polymerase sigma-B factor